MFKVTHNLVHAVVLVITLVAIGISLPANAAESVDFKIYLSPHGDDANSGFTPGQAVLSLNKAHKILLAYQPQVPVEIIVKAGTYSYQVVEWKYTNNQRIVFRAQNEAGKRPVFDGRKMSDTWFTFKGQSGKSSKLEFRHLQVQNYNTAMSFKGNRNHEQRGNSHNTLYSMYFYRIGGKYSPRSHSTAAVRFVNSSFNRVTNSHFIEILNPGEKAHLIHAVYMAHHSSHNEIKRNRFVRINGDPIKVRDSSNNNRIERNRFYSAGKKAVFQDWYCQDGPDNCTKPAKECPSSNNIFTENLVGRGFYGEIRTFELWRSNTYCGKIDGSRLRTSKNVDGG